MPSVLGVLLKSLGNPLIPLGIVRQFTAELRKQRELQVRQGFIEALNGKDVVLIHAARLENTRVRAFAQSAAAEARRPPEERLRSPRKSCPVRGQGLRTVRHSHAQDFPAIQVRNKTAVGANGEHVRFVAPRIGYLELAPDVDR